AGRAVRGIRPAPRVFRYGCGSADRDPRRGHLFAAQSKGRRARAGREPDRSRPALPREPAARPAAGRAGWSIRACADHLPTRLSAGSEAVAALLVTDEVEAVVLLLRRH